MARSVEPSIVTFHAGTDIAGVGFLADRRRILTCAHVVNTALGRDPRGQDDPRQKVVEVQFPLIENHPVRKARVVVWVPPPAEGEPATDLCDIAGLELLPAETPPVGATGVRFAEPRTRADVEVFGYPSRPARSDGSWVPGRMLGPVGSGLRQLDSDRLAAIRAQPGYSGAPVVSSGRVVGMFASASILDSQHDCYAIPPSWLRRAWPGVVKTAPVAPRVPPVPPRTRRLLMIGAAAVVPVLLAGFLLFDDDDPAACTTPVPLQVSVSTEKDELLARLAADYNAAGRTFADGACARVTTAGLTSGTAMDVIADGWPAGTGQPRPQVWLPTSSMWTDLLRDGGHGDMLTTEESPSVTTSVLAIAMRQRMADALRERYGEVGWADILELARPDNGWAAVGHPEWGKFVLGRDNPHNSTSGLAASVATYFAAAKKQRGITEADLNRGEVAEFVHGIESSVDRYGKEATVFMEELYEQDRSGSTEEPVVSAVVIQEQLAYLYNRGAPTGDPAKIGTGAPNEPLVAVHPKEGTVELDHPFEVLSWASEEQRAAAADFLTFLTDDERQQAFVELGFRELDRPTRQTQLLADTVGGSTADEQTFYELPAPPLVKAMQDAWDSTRRKARVLLLLDVSESMDEDADRTDSETTSKLDLLLPAAKHGLSFLGPEDQVGIWSFSGTLSVRLEMSRVGDVRDRLDGIIDELETSLNTALYDATAAAHQEMVETIDRERINAVVLLSDGRNHPRNDAGRARLLADLDAANRETSVRVFTIPYGADADTELLAAIADRTRAELYNATDPEDIEEVMAAVFSNFGSD